MKTILSSIFDGLFSAEIRKDSNRISNNLFFAATDPISGRILMIEEDDYSIWGYMLSPDKEEIDFDGFLCTVVTPSKQKNDLKKISKHRNPLPAQFANSYSYIKNLKRKDIRIHWKEKCAAILVRNKVQLVMNMDTKTSYSKGLSTDCLYGKTLEEGKLD
ncbi:hypothetical protein D1816_09665 [Aquimarina sp. AD10]|uniref:Uncharacterized protein n=1 Tax=Aquimarina aggregata TaxID=1642818 RepID=A0A162WYH6_9FLAO|nr:MULTISPECIES: hypothetical protein [Aquimarina]AXT60607.1 hypothetical protein D1816_09665 [Aquimarina sp. AD10]KZS38333.1 hypothetical protein AWE51_17400 [Aquimarina aggregata]RKN01700.1 hypothetical protein D7033_03530 [Aquimarina sp. AD10]